MTTTRPVVAMSGTGRTASPPTALPVGLWLNVGSGPLVVDGWTSIDGSWQAWFANHPMASRLASIVAGRAVGHWPAGIVCRDIRSGLGIGDATAAVVYSSHFIEHLPRHDAMTFLRACRRVLAEGGVCRIVTPDLGALVHRYQEQRASGAPGADEFIAATLLAPGSEPARPWLRWYRAATQFESHKWLYDGESLVAAMRDAGFAGSRVCGYLDSAIPRDRLAQVEIRERIEDGQGVVVEGVA